MDKVLLIVLGVVGALVGSMFALGILTPVEHSASKTIVLERPVEDVWDLITDFESAPNWRPEVHQVVRGPDQNGNAVWVESGEFGEMPLEVVVFEPTSTLATRIADDTLPWGGVWTYEFESMGNGTLLTITEDGFVRMPLYRFLNKYVFGYDSTISFYMENLAHHFDETPNFVE